MTEYILDIDHLIGLMDGDESLVKQLDYISGKQKDARFGITTTILSELYFMSRLSAQMESNVAAITELVASLYVWEWNRGAAEITGEILAQQTSLGRPITSSEAQIAAVARQRRAVVLSNSPHFREIRDIQVENWLRQIS